MPRFYRMIYIFLLCILIVCFVACSVRHGQNPESSPSSIPSADTSPSAIPPEAQPGIPPNQPGNLSNPAGNQQNPQNNKPPVQPGNPPANPPGNPLPNPPGNPPPNPPGNPPFPPGNPPNNPAPPGMRFFRNRIDDAQVVFIPAGKFKMGVAPGDTQALSDEQPMREVYVDSYCIYEREVTVYQFQKFVEATRYFTTAEKNGSPNVWRQRRSLGMMPVTNVSYEDAAAYCKWAGGRLPTEAEWEKAARGDMDERMYPWGNILEKNFFNSELMDFEKWNTVRPPRTLGHGLLDTGRLNEGQSPFGVQDMTGNAWEWVSDWYSRDYRLTDGAVNPTGPPEGREKILKGGGIEANPIHYRISGRKHAAPLSFDPTWGFRCVLDKNAIDENQQ